MSNDRLVYGLVDPRTSRCRYVGLSTRGMARPRVHLGRIRDNDHTHRANWLRGLRKAGFQPKIIVLEYCDTDEQLSLAEQKWISMIDDLTNHLGGGLSGGRMDESTRRKIGDAVRGLVHSPEAVRHMSEAKMGEKNPMFGKPVSEETRKKRGDKLRGEKNHRFGKTPPIESIPTRFKPGHATWNKGIAGLSGEQHPMFGKHHTDEAKAKMSASSKGREPPNKGVPMSAEQIRKLVIARTGSKMRCSICKVLGHNKQTCSQTGVVSV